MSDSYVLERKFRIEKTISDLLADSPEYFSDFCRYLNDKKLAILTKRAYISDIKLFLSYLHNNVAGYRLISLKDMPLSAFLDVSTDDLNGYRVYLCLDMKLGNTSILKRFAAISAFYKYLNNSGISMSNPIKDFSLPKPEEKKTVKLTSEMANRLLEGILRNDKFLHSNTAIDKAMNINEAAFVRREPVILRNYAICCLFLGAGLRLSDLVGLDLKDVDLAEKSIRLVSADGGQTYVYFGEEVSEALRTYLNGIPLPESLIERLSEEEICWCRSSIKDRKFTENLQKKYPNRDPQFYGDMTALTKAMRRQGREGLGPHNGCNAFFISSRGERMSVRMVEVMIKEMVRTYLPFYDDRKVFSPHNLRITCASRLLIQTGSVELTAAQLNQINTKSTEKLYKEIKKEQEKDKIRNLKINKW